MLTYERQSNILEFILKRRSVSVQELSEQFDVSPMTIRRDLKDLEQKKLVVRIRGGVTIPDAIPGIPEEKRAAINIAQKAAIGEEAARFVQDGQTIFIDAGTTTLELVNRLKNFRGLTVVTNAVKVLYALAAAPGINLIGVGGAVYGGAWSFIGPLAESGIRRFHSDLAFLGITSLSLNHGLTEINYFEGDIKNLIIKQSQRVIILADSSKFEKVSPHSVVPLTEVDVIITDEQLPEDVASAYRKTGIELIIARKGGAFSSFPTGVMAPPVS